MSTLPQPADRTAELEAEVEQLRESLATLAGAHGEIRRRLAKFENLLGIAKAQVETPYERAAASTRPLSARLATAGISVVRDGG